jgi:hypothetical protein
MLGDAQFFISMTLFRLPKQGLKLRADGKPTVSARETSLVEREPSIP